MVEAHGVTSVQSTLVESAQGQSRRFRRGWVTSGLPLTADLERSVESVEIARCGPIPVDPRLKRFSPDLNLGDSQTVSDDGDSVH